MPRFGLGNEHDEVDHVGLDEDELPGHHDKHVFVGYLA